MANPPVVVGASPPVTTPPGYYTLPADLSAYRLKLIGVGEAVAKFDKTMDGMFFGYVGADAFLSAIPWVGDVFSGLTTFWLLSKASEVKMPIGDIITIFGLGALDVALGYFPVAGDTADIFFRAHAWNGQRIIGHIQNQLAQIALIESQLVKTVPITQHRENLDHLRDSLFRGGKTKKEAWLRIGIVSAICVALLTYCAHEAYERHQRVVACKARTFFLFDWWCNVSPD